VSTTITGTLVEIGDTFLVLDGDTHIIWIAERIERGAVGGRSMRAASSSGRKNAISCGGGSGACPRG